MTATENIRRLGQDLIDMAIAYKEDHVTLEELKEERYRIILIIPFIALKNDGLFDLMAYNTLLHSIELRYFLIMSKPKPPKFKEGCKAYIRTGEEKIILPNGRIINKIDDKNMSPLP